MWKMEDDVRRINERISEILIPDEPKELSDAMRHLILSGGKRLRPIIAMHSAGAINPDAVSKGMDAGISMELIHNFTLIHDDIMDRSAMRRRVKTTHVIFGEEIAIDAGDGLFAKALLVLYDLPHTRRLLGEVSQMVYDVCKGQAMDIIGSRKLLPNSEIRDPISMDWYLKMIEYKTARLIEVSARCGAIVAGASEAQQEALGRFGWNVGMAFQMQDDLLDAVGGEKTGKAVGGDIREGKNTILVVHALENASGRDRKVIRDGLGHSDKVKEVIEAFGRAGSIDFARKLAGGYTENARNALSKLKDSPDKEVLMQILDYTLKREK